MKRSVTRRIGAVSLVAGLVLAAAWAARPPGASAEAADPAEDQTGTDAAQCGGDGPIELPSPDAEILSLMQQDLNERAQQPEAAADAAGWVVLNNRGYNYGPPPGIRFDALLPARPPNANEGAR